jgi:hypothetical protein
VKSLFIVTFLFCLVAEAYIPRTQTIVKKMSRNNGRREYNIVREVILETQEKQIKAREQWTVAHGDKMKLQVTSLNPQNPWSFSILYSARDRQTLSQSEKLKSFKKSADFFEPLFHDRSHRSLLKRLISYKFVPDWVPDAPTPTYNEGQTAITPEPFVQLAPMEGNVNYALGAQTNSQGGRNQTKLWVEQDSFLITKGRLRSQAEFVNRDFRSFAGGLKLPAEQQISWDEKTARIKLIKVERTRTNKKDWMLKAQTGGGLPSDPLIKEFYSRFR